MAHIFLTGKTVFSRIARDIRTYSPALLLFCIYNMAVRHFFHAFCPFLIMSGFPCAGCGMTRAIACFLTGQWIRAMNLNPAAPLWIAWILFFAVQRYLFGKKNKWTMRLLGAVCVITLAVYGWRMATQFPGNPPMTYYKNNILGRILRLLQRYFEI